MSERSLSKSKLTTRQLTILGLLAAILIILGTTGLGFIPIPPFKKTIMHIPVIIGAILEGPIIGGILGLIFGLFSMFNAINTPTPTAFIFMNPIVAVLPRILIGITSYYAYKFIKFKSKFLRLSLATAVGSFTNTIGVVGVIYMFYFNDFANSLHISKNIASGTLLGMVLSGFLTAAISIMIVVPIITALKRNR